MYARILVFCTSYGWLNKYTHIDFNIERLYDGLHILGEIPSRKYKMVILVTTNLIN